jgi:hypothetical protein
MNNHFPAKKYRIATLASLLSVFANQPITLSQPVTMGSRGCGAGCRIDITELTQASDMGNGWRKILIREDVFLMNWGEEDSWRRARPNELRMPTTSQYWIFAQCNGSYFARGQHSDGTDAQSESIYNDDGSKKETTVSGNVYDQWESLCNSGM